MFDSIRPESIQARSPQAFIRREQPRADGQHAIPLLAAGVALELVFAFGFLAPLALWNHPRVVTSPQPIATALGRGVAGALIFGIPVLLAFALFVLALRCAPKRFTRGAIWFVLGGTLLFSLTLLPTNPLASKDIFHNIFDARTFWLHGANPAIVPPNAHPHDPLYRSVSAWQSFASSYGPAWYLIAGLPIPFARDALWANVLGQKALTVAFLLGTTWLVMLLAERLRPGSGVTAGILCGWNPLLQFETAGNAHNDIVMVFFAVAALYAVSRRWWVAIFPLLALAVMTKYVLILLGPLILLWLLAQREVPRRQIAISLALGLAVVLALEAPFFDGRQSLTHMLKQASYVTSSPAALLYTVLHTGFQVRPPLASGIAKAVAIPPFLIAYALVVRHLARTRELAALVEAGFWATFLLLVLMTWWFWPWYVVMIVPLAAIVPEKRAALVASVFSATALLMYLPYFWLLHTNPILLEGATVAVAYLAPALCAAWPHVSAVAHRWSTPLPQAEHKPAQFPIMPAERLQSPEPPAHDAQRPVAVTLPTRTASAERHGSPS